MVISVCIGSSCHLKGARSVVEELERLIDKNGLAGSVELKGTFCMGRCTDGVSVEINGEIYSLSPEDTEVFFNDTVLFINGEKR